MSIRQADGVSMEFVHVPAGEFLMGSDKKKDPQTFEWELPQHKVDLSEYWIGRFPVTVAQFTAFIKASGRQCSAEANPKKGDHPVTQVSWNDADAFCTWLTRLIQASGQKNLKVHLPSEAQWEKAARGTDARIYPWGNQKLSDKLCNYGRKVGSTTPVGQYSPQGDSPYGCVDMAGNVWEWTQDWLDSNYYQHSAGKDPGGTSSGEHRVLRGGSWLDSGWVVRAALRGWGSPDLRSVDIGFRCAASP
jgi:serine/threonine-protein kinase